MAKKTTKTSAKKEYDVCVEESLNGTPILNLEPDVARYGFKIGAKKLSLVLEHLEDVKLFLERHPYTPKVRIEMTDDQKALWKKARTVLKTGLVDVIKVKQALIKGGFSDEIANRLIDEEVLANRTKAESLLGL